MGKIWQWVVGGTLVAGAALTQIFLGKKDKKTFKNLTHCKVPKEWEGIRNSAWDRASSVLKNAGLNPITKCKSIVVEPGIKINPKTKQWGRMMMRNGKEFWYAGLSSPTEIKIVATPDNKPYVRSEPILTHEAGESILHQDKNWAHKSDDERNNFLWSLGI